MDFHSLARRELQALCKKNKIPANITNVAMADALKSLEIVEGIEEIMEPSQSEIAKLSIESRTKLEVTSPYVPPSSCRSTRRRHVMIEEPETVKTMSRTRLSTRKPLAKDAHEYYGGATEMHDVLMNPLKESVDNEKHDVLMTPAPAGVASRKRRAKEESTVQRVYSTRRSARLVEKSTKILNEVDDSEASKISKHESLTKIGCSDVKKNLKRGLDDMDEGSAVTGVDENTSSLDDPEECESEVVSTIKQDSPICEEIIHLESEKPELKMEAIEEKSEEAELPTGERDDIPEEKSEEAELPTGERDDIPKEQSEEAELPTGERADIPEEKSEEAELPTGERNDIDETETGFEMARDFDGVGIDIVDELDKEGTGTEPNDEKCEDPSDGGMPLKLSDGSGNGIGPDTEAELDLDLNADEIEESYKHIEFDVLGDEQSTEATLVGSPFIKEHLLVDDAEFLVSPQIPTSFGGSGLPLNSASKASKTRVIAVLPDNKENNISSCGKFKLVPIKGRAKDNNPVNNLSNMSVTKMPKEKLTITNNPIKDDHGSEGIISRPALQALPQNRAVDETCNN